MGNSPMRAPLFGNARPKSNSHALPTTEKKQSGHVKFSVSICGQYAHHMSRSTNVCASIVPTLDQPIVSDKLIFYYVASK